MNDAEKDVGDLKRGFGTLRDDVTVLESARSQLMAAATGTAIEPDQHNDESASELSGLLGTVEEKKEKIEDIKDFTHPCGGSGWVQVEYLGFRESGMSSPSAFAQTMYPERPYTCGIKSQTTEVCDLLTISVGGRQYSKVCAWSYQSLPIWCCRGVGRQAEMDRTINEVYLSGISLTHGGTFSDPSDPPTHIIIMVIYGRAYTISIIFLLII